MEHKSEVANSRCLNASVLLEVNSHDTENGPRERLYLRRLALGMTRLPSLKKERRGMDRKISHLRLIFPLFLPPYFFLPSSENTIEYVLNTSNVYVAVKISCLPRTQASYAKQNHQHGRNL